MKYRKSEAGLGMFLIIALVALVFVWYVNVSQRECNSNKDCNSESYCGSDFSCHPYPIIQKTEVHYSLWLPALIIGIAIIIAAGLFNWDKVERVFKKNGKESHDNHDFGSKNNNVDITQNETVGEEEHENGHGQIVKKEKVHEEEYYKPNSNP